MMNTHRMGLSRPALLCLSLLAVACGGGGGGGGGDGGVDKPPVTTPPQAMLSVPQPNTAGLSLTVQVGAKGCNAIQSLSIYDGEEFIKAVPYSGDGGMVSVEIGAAELKYARGIAAQLTLKSRVVCTDGRQNDSLQQPATFFPVAEVIELPAGNTGQVVPDFFVAAGSGVGLYFIGCGNLPNGIGRLFKVSKTGEVLASVDMLFPCTVNTVITGVHPTSRKRWVWTPGSGAIAVDEQLNISGKTGGQIGTLTVGPGGDALIFNSATGSLQRVSHVTGAFKWSQPYSVRGGLIAAPMVNTSGVVLVPSVGSDPSIGTVILTATVDWGDQNAATGGLETGSFIVKQLSFSQTTLPRLPTAAFNADGTVLYVTLEGAAQLTQVFACGTRANGCEGSAQRWSQVPVLEGSILALVPYANGGRVAAIGSQKMWFLDTSTGNVMNKGKQPISTQSALVTLQVQPGGGPAPQSFFILNGPAPTQGLPTPIPVEIVGLDSAENGLLYRYQINSGTLGAAVDDSGTLWLRVGRKLVRPLTVAEYRQVRPVTP